MENLFVKNTENFESKDVVWKGRTTQVVNIQESCIQDMMFLFFGVKFCNPSEI